VSKVVDVGKNWKAKSRCMGTESPLFNHMMFASSFLLHVEVGWLVKKLNPLLEGDFCSDGRLH
jgi:hypothetical protein